MAEQSLSSYCLTLPSKARCILVGSGSLPEPQPRFMRLLHQYDTITTDGRWIKEKSFVVLFYTSSFCLWERSFNCSYTQRKKKYLDWEQLLDCCATSKITNMKQNWKYFRYVHNFYILEIKKVLVLFNEISSFRLREDDSTTHILHFFVEWYYQHRAYGINILFVHSCKYCTHTHIRICKIWKQPNVLSTMYASIYIFLDFCAFLDVAQHS